MQKHIRLAIYQLTKGSFGELAGLTKDGMLPRFSMGPGFIEYGVADIGNRKVASITVWETREQAENSVGVASTWVRENISDRVKLLTSYVGDVAFLRPRGRRTTPPHRGDVQRRPGSRHGLGGLDERECPAVTSPVVW